jgi:membrane fusion protein, copper/silver efflux system
MFWMDRYEDIEESIEKLVDALDMSAMRVHFEPLSEAFIETARTLGAIGQTWYVAFCPMYDDDRGAYWLSEFEEIKNPYFGDMMLRCGEVRETLREGVAAGQREESREMEGHVH